jgi:hypothetical protein
MSRRRLKDPGILRTVGLVALILASLSRWFLHPTTIVGPSLVHATTGLLYGVSISCLLMSLRRTNRPCADEQA